MVHKCGRMWSCTLTRCLWGKNSWTQNIQLYMKFISNKNKLVKLPCQMMQLCKCFTTRFTFVIFVAFMNWIDVLGIRLFVLEIFVTFLTCKFITSFIISLHFFFFFFSLLLEKTFASTCFFVFGNVVFTWKRNTTSITNIGLEITRMICQLVWFSYNNIFCFTIQMAVRLMLNEFNFGFEHL